jgi:hypothetical protein
MEREVERQRTWREALGIDAPEREDEANAPPVDEELLRRYVRDELPEAVARHVDSLTARFKSWGYARCLIGAVEFRKGDN